MRLVRVVSLVLLSACSAVTMEGAVRLTYPLGGAPTPLYWPASAPITYQIAPDLAQNISEKTVDDAFVAWTKIPGANIHFRSLGVVAGARPGQDGKNTVGIADSLFKDQGLIAVTTYFTAADDSGRITEADIQVDPAYVPSIYPAEPTIQHEVGHLLGFDHSGVLSSVMYPYVAKDKSDQFDSDDTITASILYPTVDPSIAGATLTGRITADGTGVFAAQVVALDENGQPVSTALTDVSGDYTLEAIPSGTYRVYAEPLDGPVTPQNLAGIYTSAKVTPFATRYVSGGPIQVDAGKVYGNLNLDVSGAPAQLNPRWIGIAPPGIASFSLYSAVVTMKAGERAEIAVGGDGFTSGMTTFSISNPSARRVSDFHYSGNYLYATFELGAEARGGSANIVVTSGNDTAMLTGAVRIVSATAAPRLRSARH